MSVRRQMKQEKREKKRERQKERKKERKRKIVNLAYLAEHRISIFLGLRFETRNFVLRQ